MGLQVLCGYLPFALATRNTGTATASPVARGSNSSKGLTDGRRGLKATFGCAVSCISMGLGALVAGWTSGRYPIA